MVLLAKATDRELARMISYLKEENRILRARLPERINVTPKERERLWRLGRSDWLVETIVTTPWTALPRLLARLLYCPSSTPTDQTPRCRK